MELERNLETYLRTGSWLGSSESNPIEVEAGVVYARIVGWERVYNDAEGRDKMRRAEATPTGRFRVK